MREIESLCIERAKFINNCKKIYASDEPMYQHLFSQFIKTEIKFLELLTRRDKFEESKSNLLKDEIQRLKNLTPEEQETEL